mgnify:CR=1 FL=1
MPQRTRRNLLKATGVAASVGLAGCGGTSGGSSDGSSSTPSGEGQTSLSPMAISGTINHPRWSAALDQGFYADRGLDITPQYKPFPAQIQAVSGGSVKTALE